ncbi:unnamed protein product, partial [marine sediment metagenome]
YARAIAKRFYDVVAEKKYKYLKRRGTLIYQGELSNKLRHFVPTLLDSHLYRRLPKKPQRIFVGSMSEIYHWNEEWIERVIEKVKQYPQHIFIFLTKHMEVYADWRWPGNCILGVTITNKEDFEKQRGSYYFYNEKNKTLFCFEPLLGDIYAEYIQYSNVNWIIIGAESGNRKGKVVPKRSWVGRILSRCHRYKIPVYIKDNLSKYYDEYKRYKQFPTINKL